MKSYIEPHTGLNDVDAILLDSRAGLIEYEDEADE